MPERIIGSKKGQEGSTEIPAGSDSRCPLCDMSRCIMYARNPKRQQLPAHHPCHCLRASLHDGHMYPSTIG
ncbi:hypothetical protein KQX54_020767 [Cotesia glomerata]|uniref:Uncharacterized protein n=1 Tax=Cotesia glomerata TaxID=32391 RepID=A0AAV7IHA2_COTGL|nr:hypothetical protein KQX54_020767 [Cotesia glomerata]